MPNPPTLKIDAEALIRSKNPTLANWLPRFVLRYIKRILHQEYINDFLARHGDKRSFAFVDAVIKAFGVTVSYEGLENLPVSGGCIVVSNHPIGGLDGMALLQVIGEKRRDVRFMVNDLLMNIRNLEDLFIGVNKHGKNQGQTFAEIDSVFAGSGVMAIFPAGLVSRKNHGLIRDLTWKKTFVAKAKQYERPIVPVHISGRNSDFFYNLARLRSRLGIRANIEMFYLMDEMYHQLGKNIHLKFGRPIQPGSLSPRHSDHTWAQKIKEHIYNLAEGKDEFPT